MDRRDRIPAPDSIHASPLDRLCVLYSLRVLAEFEDRFNLRRDVNELLAATARHLVWPRRVLEKLQRYLKMRCADNPAWAEAAALEPEAFMQRHGHYGQVTDDAAFYYYLDEFVKQHPKDLWDVVRVSVEALTAQLAGERVLLAANIDMLARALALPPLERELLVYAAVCKYHRELRPLLCACKVNTIREAHEKWSSMFGYPVADIAAAVKTGARLESLGLVETPYNETSIGEMSELLRVPDRLMPVLLADYQSEAELMRVFTRPGEKAALSLGDFPHIRDDARYLAALLKSACAAREKGINVLVYGPSGTGKTEFARLLAELAAAELYEVDCLDKQGASLSGKDRYRAMRVSQAFLRDRSNTVLLFDEVEDVFPSRGAEVMSFFGQEDATASVNGKAWVNQTLESNPVPTVWVSNNIRQIDPAYLRRFQFHLEIKTPPKDVRERITRKYLADLPVSEAFMTKLAARETLTPALIQSAARFATLTQSELGESVEDLIGRQLDYADRALGREDKQREGRPSVTHYDLALLNLDARYPVEKVIAALKLHGRATLCFYGPPGTGKSALAEHIAREIDRPLMVKLASDVMSKYVGETEQNMAAMFAAAKAEKSVLLLDEADSFLQSRAGAQRNWEVSEVNEMLQQMERFEGIFICTTNLFDRLDEAALRRFAFKVRFKPLKVEQRDTMFVQEALEGDVTRLTAPMRTRLAKMHVLTAGDFAVVKRQVLLFGEALAPEAFLAELEREHGAKPEVRYERSLGFVH